MKGNKKKVSKVLLSSTLLLTMFFTTMPTSVFALDNVASPKAGEIAIDDKNFPDPVFRNYILDATNVIDNDKNGSLSQTEIENVNLIDVTWTSGEKISSLKGIEYFTALTRLECSDNQLTSLDVSKNTLLTDLWCNSNLLTSLDVSKNTALTDLSCMNNSITNINVSENKLLTDLWCSSNPLTSLDVSKNTFLKGLVCSSNQLTNLDISANTSLSSLVCSSNSLKSLDVSKHTALIQFDCSSNQLTSLDVSKNTLLKVFNCKDNQLTSLDVSKHTALIQFDCSNQKSTILYDKNKGYQLSAYDTGFVKGNASKFVGATYNDGTLTGVKFKTPITYDYNTGCKIAGLEMPMDVTLTFDEKKDKPTITVGSGSNHQVNSSNDMAFTCSGKLEDLNGVYVDGKLVAESNYTLKSGSTILTLKSSYLDTLSVGKHILKFQYKDNVAAETNFTITTKTDETPAKPSTPNTGDTSNTMLCFGLMVLSGCLAGYSLKKKKALRS